jgi:MarR family multiple antibiotic resistance transcriptional regulator
MENMDKKQLVGEIVSLWRKIRQTLEERDPSPWLRLNLSRGQLRILFLLSSTGRMSPGAVAAALGVPKANVTEIIERLVQQGLTQRESNPQDRRSHTLLLTKKGQTQVERLREWSTGRTERAIERVPEDELEGLAHSLEVMLTAAQQISVRNQSER